MCSNFCNYIFMNLAIINSYIKIKIKSYDSYFYNNNNINTSYNTNHKKNDSVIIDIPPEHITSNNKIKITIDDYKEPNSPINEWDIL